MFFILYFKTHENKHKLYMITRTLLNMQKTNEYQPAEKEKCFLTLINLLAGSVDSSVLAWDFRWKNTVK